MRFHVVIDRHTGEVIKTEEVSDDFSLADAVAHCEDCSGRKPVGFVSAEELDAAVAQALHSSPRWRRRLRGARR